MSDWNLSHEEQRDLGSVLRGSMRDSVTVHIEDVPRSSIMDALIAIELADSRGVFDEKQHQRLTALVLGLRKAQGAATDA